MLENCAILDEKILFSNGAILKGRKPAKLSTFKTFYPKTVEIRNKIRKSEESPQVEPKQEIATTKPVENVVQAPNKEVKNENQQSQSVQKQESNVIQFPSKEVLEKKSKDLNVVFYNDVLATIIHLDSYRRLRVASLVYKILLHTKKVVALTPEPINSLNGNIQQIPNKENNIVQSPKKEEPKKETFDFSQVSNIDLTNVVQSEVNSSKAVVDNEVKLDEFLNKNIIHSESQSTVETSFVDNKIMNEINSLLKENSNTEDSIATQKEILANLRKRIEQNKALCEAKRQELEEENMALTQELNGLLAEVNQLSDIANQQEAFLGIDNKVVQFPNTPEEESKQMVAK